MIKYLYKFFSAVVLLSSFSCMPYISNVSNYQSYASDTIDNIGYEGAEYEDKNIASVVKLSYLLIFPDGVMEYSSATGFSIKYDKENDISYFITNDHFCSGQPNFLPGLFTYTGINEAADIDKTAMHPMSVVYTDPVKDLCLMITSGKSQPVKFESKKYKMEKVEEVVMIGAPNGIFPIVTDGKITGHIDRVVLNQDESDGEPFLLISGNIYPGASGSPIFDMRGRVVGVVFICFINPATGLPTYGGLGIPIADVRSFLDEAGLKL